MMGQELARREAENAITQITERTEERTDESKKNLNQNIGITLA